MSRVHTILPPPFVWITVPAGKVVVITHQGCAENHLPAYAFAKYPLTNAQFSPFIQAGGYQQPQWWTNAGWQARARHNWTQPRYWDHAQWNGTDHPVVGVSWYEAVAYCRWLSDTSGETVTLPTEPEWQRAAQTMPDGRNSGYPFPWGVDWDGTCCNNSVSSQASQSTTPVQRYEGRGDSPLGIVDMSGNVSEWCLTARHTGDIDPDGTGERVQRGGAWFHFTTMFFSVTATYGSDPDRRETTLGFRLARK